MNEKMSKKQFAEYVMTRLPLDRMVQFRGVDAPEEEMFCIANIHTGDSSSYIANRTTGGHPFCFSYGSRAMFIEYAIKALHRYLCNIPAFENGVIVCSESKYPTVDKWTVEFFIGRLWYVARWGYRNMGNPSCHNKVFRVRSRKFNYEIKFRVVPFADAAIVTATEPLMNTDNVRLCCDVNGTTKKHDFAEKVTAYLRQHDIEESDDVTVIRYE